MKCHDLAWRYIAAFDLPPHDFPHIIVHCIPLVHINCTYSSHIFHRRLQTIHTSFKYIFHMHFPYTLNTLHMHCRYVFNIPSQNFTFPCCTLHYITLTSAWHRLTSHAWEEERASRKNRTVVHINAARGYLHSFKPILSHLDAGLSLACSVSSLSQPSIATCQIVMNCSMKACRLWAEGRWDIHKGVGT